MNQLKEDGVTLSVNGCDVVVKGSLIIVPADTTAAQFLGGFKEGVGFADKMCRTCHASKTDIKSNFLEGQFQKRNAADHLEKVTLMEGLSKAGFKY